jgi:hypothetical protein
VERLEAPLVFQLPPRSHKFVASINHVCTCNHQPR